jgi:threonine dehydratase
LIRTAPTLADIEAARSRIDGIARITPVYPSETLSRLTGREVLLKAENLQRTGAFKIRGAVNRIALLSEKDRAAGVVAASAGNHGQAVAWAAREAGIPATVFVPEDAPMSKVEATRNYGARVEFTGAGFDECLAEAFDYADEHGATFIHAFEDEQVIAGQGTIGLELAEQVEHLDTVVIPIGGGGLASGIALALTELRPQISIVGVQAAAMAPFTGATTFGWTIADGIAVKHPGELTSEILRDRLDAIVTVEDEKIAEAIVLLLERLKLVAEGAGAASVAALLAGKVEGNGRTVAILSGGNIDPTQLISIARHGLTLAGRSLALSTRIADRPGELMKLLALIAEEHGNIVSVEHHREGIDLPVGETGVELTLTMRGREHCEQLIAAMEAAGYPVTRLH